MQSTSPESKAKSAKAAASGRAAAAVVNLSAFLEQEVLPRLTAAQVYTHEKHRWHKAPDRWRGGCPWHDSKSGTSFVVTLDSLLWYCAGCDVGGTPVQYLHRLNGGDGRPSGQDFVDVVRRLAEVVGVTFPERELTPEERERARNRDARRAILQAVMVYCRGVLRTERGHEAREYLRGRGFADDDVGDLGLGLYPPPEELRQLLRRQGHPDDDVTASGVLFERLVGYVVFPWLDERGAPLSLYGEWPARPVPAGREKKMALHNPGPNGKPWESTKRSPLYLDRALRAGHRDLVLVEGLTDAALLQRRGDTRVISPVANKVSREQAQTLARRGVRSVVICLDPDGGGKAGTPSCVRMLLAAGVTPYVSPWLPEGLDPDEYVLRHGIDAWKEHVGRAAHGYRHVAREVIARHGERRPGDDLWADAVVGSALEFARGLPAGRWDELTRHFWPEIEAATGARTEDLRERLRVAGGPAAPPPDQGLVYREGALTIGVMPQPRKKWQVVVSRGPEALGVDVVKLADSQERHDLVRRVRDLTPEEREALAGALVRLAVTVERDWARHERGLHEKERQRLGEQSERLAAEHAERRRQYLEELEGLAGGLLRDPALLYRLGEAMAGRGLVGERENGLLLSLCVLSQVTGEPISAAVKGDSSGGKSHLVKVVLEVVPDEAHIDLTSMSEKALIYDQRDYAHRTVVIYEVHGEGGEFSTYLIRTLISEGEIRHLTVESTPLGPVGREIVKQGPTNFITTTTLPELHAENETRIWTILVDDSPPTTRRVLAVQADRARGVFQPGDVDDLHAAFAWLHAAGAKEAVVPFADLLAAAMPDRPLRLRRDFPRLLQLVKVCALLHQRQRQLDGQGRVLADLADYAMARELVAPIFMRAIAGVTEKTLELVEALDRVLDAKAQNGGDRKKARASYSDLVEETGRPKHYVSRWLRPALEIGLVDNENAGEKGRPAALKMGKFEVDDGGDVLPPVGEVAQTLNADVRWVSPITGREQVLQCCKPDCNGILFTQGVGNKRVGATGGASVAVLQGGEGGMNSPAPEPPPQCDPGSHARRENTSPPPPSNTATLCMPPPATR
jgi:hypothetical protein